jgi:hypothetical protein
MSTTLKNSLLLVLVVGSLVGPAAAAAKPVYEPGDVPRTRLQTQVESYANRPAASYYSPQALRAMGARLQAEADVYSNKPAALQHAGQLLQAMGDRWAAQAAFNRSRAAMSDITQTAASPSTGDRWGADALAQSRSTGSNVTASQTASHRDDGSNVLTYILIVVGILVAGSAALYGVSQLRGDGSTPRVAIP